MSEGPITRAINDIQARCANFERIIQDLNRKIDELCKAALHLQELEKKITDAQSVLEAKILEQKKNSEDHKAYLSQVLETLSQKSLKLFAIIDKHEDAFSFQANKNKEHSEKMQNYLEYTNSNISIIYDTLRKEIKEAIEAIPKAKIPSFSEIIELIGQKIEATTLEAKNGYLRASNCDLRLTIVEKKIDQIFLLLQKHSLNQ